MRHVLGIGDLDRDGLAEVLARSSGALAPALSGKGAALVFEHPSARTRNAAEMAVVQLGGHPVTIRGEDIGFDVREPVEDVARVLAGYYAVIGARVARHATLERMVRALEGAGRTTPVINLLSDREHPTQALADLLTIEQCTGGLEGRSVCYVGDANNVCRSLVLACALAGAEARVASPPGYALSDADLEAVRALGGSIAVFAAAADAAAGADVLYTDVWISMGEESDAAEKRAALEAFRIDEALLELASPTAIVLHCLPAHRGEEVSAEVIDGPKSKVFAQAENRMHALRGLLSVVCEAAQ